MTWRGGTKGPLSVRFAALRVRVGDGATFANNRHLPGEDVWLVGEWRANGERKYYLSNLSPRTSRRTLARAIKARWACEQAHQQLKDELGLDHYEGRSWLGLHHHALLTMMAFTYLQHRRLASNLQAGKKNSTQCTGSATPAITASGTSRHSRRAASSDSRQLS